MRIQSQTHRKRSLDISQNLNLHPLLGPDPQIQPVPSPPLPDPALAPIFTADTILQRLLDITSLILDSEAAVFPPLQHVVVAVLGGADQDLVVEDHFGAFEGLPC